MPEALVVVIHGNRKHFFGALLANDILVEYRVDFLGDRQVILLVLAAGAGFAGVPILAIMFAVAGLLLLDVVMIGSLWRVIFRRKG